MGTENTIKLMDGLAIYKQKGSKNWYMSLTLKPGDDQKRARPSLHTPDENEAKKKALGLYYGYHGNILAPDTFTVKKQYIKEIAEIVIADFDRRKAEGGAGWKITYDAYRKFLVDIIPIWGHKTIKQLKESEIEEYYRENVHSKTQLNTKNTAFRWLFDRAVKLELIERHHTPKLPGIKDLSKVNQELKNEFSENHIKVFESKFPDFIKNARKGISKDRRRMLMHYFGFLRETGIRPGEEALNIKVSDFKILRAEEAPMSKDEIQELVAKHGEGHKDATHKTILPFFAEIRKGKIHGRKGVKPRMAMLNDGGLYHINSILRFFWGWDYGLGPLLKEPTGKKSVLDERVREIRDSFIFRTPDGQSTKPQFEKTFEQLCVFTSPFKKGVGAKGGKRGGMALDNSVKYEAIEHKEDNISLYSCRHTYITDSIISGISLTTIAAQCGTSQKMIEERYSHMTPAHKIVELSQHKARY
ncbi:MAG: hypothetical protein ACSHWQ_06085 [Spongiibacteraceae bacterium]